LRVVSANISERKGVPKQPVDSVELLFDSGVKGDAHAGPGDRQVSLLAIESYEKFRKQRRDEHCLKNGSFGENIITEGLVLHELALGTRLRVGTAVLEISKIGKECHAPCAIGKATGECIMPKEGVFARVILSGDAGKGDEIYLL